MNNRTLLTLSIVLLSQIILFFVLYLNQQAPTQLPKQSLIGSFDIQKTQRIDIKANRNIADANATDFALEKVAENWQIKTDSGRVWVDNAKVNKLLNTLATLKPSLSVANSDEAQQRFEVAEDKYQRLLTFQTDNQSFGLYLGTSPGYQQTHARPENDSNIYAIKLSNFDVSASTTDWLKLSQFTVNSTITSIKASDFLIQRQSSRQWTISNLAAKEVANQENANKLADTFKNLRITGLATQALPADSITRLLVKTAQQGWNFSLAKANDGYFIQRDDGAVFTISERQYNSLALKPFYIKEDGSDNEPN